MQCLLDAGAVTDKAKIDGTTALHLAVKEGQEAVVQFLLDAGADTEKADIAGETALHFAAAKVYQVAVVRCLLDAGADKDKAHLDGATPLRVAQIGAIRQLCSACSVPVPTKRRQTTRGEPSSPGRMARKLRLRWLGPRRSAGGAMNRGLRPWPPGAEEECSANRGGKCSGRRHWARARRL